MSKFNSKYLKFTCNYFVTSNIHLKLSVNSPKLVLFKSINRNWKLTGKN